MSKVVQQLPRRIEDLQGSKVLPKQPLRKIDTQACEIDTHLWEMKMKTI
jgi:hypothetical protein